MPNIVFKDRAGEDIVYPNVQSIVAKDENGVSWTYSLGGGGGVGTLTILQLTNYTDSHATALATITSPENGDLAVIVAPIDGTSSTATKWERTAYRYNTELSPAEWTALDGNYSMTNVFLDKDLQATTDVGFIESGDIITKGTSMKSLIQSMLQQELYPIITQPNSSFTYNVSATSTASSTDVEGAVVTPKITINLTPGNYQYGPTPTGVTFTAGTIDGSTATISSNTMTATFSEITLSSSTSSYSKPYTYTHTAGEIPLTNIGNEYPAGQIAAATQSKTATSSLMYNTLSVTKPTITISTGSVAADQEVGTQVSPTYTITINNPTGAYPYGHVVGTKGTSESAELVVSNQSKTVDGTTSSFTGYTNTGTWPTITIGTSTQSKSISASCAYSASPNVPVSQYGNAVPSKQITASTASKSATLSVPVGMRQIFWGYTTVKTGIDSAVIRAVAGHKKNAALTNVDLAEDTSKVAIIIAAPTGTRTLTSVKMPSSSMADVTSQFVKQTSTVNVEGANGYTAVAYDLWVYAPATMGGTYQINMA